MVGIPTIPVGVTSGVEMTNFTFNPLKLFKSNSITLNVKLLFHQMCFQTTQTITTVTITTFR